MDLNTVSLIVSILGIAVSVLTTVWVNYRLRKSVGIAFSLDVRRNIERLERTKEQFKQSEPNAYRELFDAQGELETIDAKLTAIFNLKKRNDMTKKNQG